MKLMSFTSVLRIVAAFISAPLVPAILISGMEGLEFGADEIPGTFRNAFEVACLLTLVFALPAFFLLLSPSRSTAIHFAITGSFIAALPPLIILLVPGSTSTSYYEFGQSLVVNGHRTLAFWLLGGRAVLIMAIFGFLGGMTFWLVASAGSR